MERQPNPRQYDHLLRLVHLGKEFVMVVAAFVLSIIAIVLIVLMYVGIF